MKWAIRVLLMGLCLSWQAVSFADGEPDMIPELKDIEKIASQQEAAIRAQSDALLKAQKDKEDAEKAAAQAAQQKPAAPTVAVAETAPTPVKHVKKVVAKKPAAKKTKAKRSKPKTKKKVHGPNVIPTERMDLRLTKQEKAKIMARSKKTKKTVTGVVMEAVHKAKW